MPPVVLDLALLAGNRIRLPRQLDSLKVPEPIIEFMGVGVGLGEGQGQVAQASSLCHQISSFPGGHLP